MFKRYFLFSLVGLVLAGFMFFRSNASEPKKSAQLAAPVVGPDGILSVGAIRLYRDYQENEVAADTRYKGQRLRVTGTVTAIERDYSGQPVLHLVSGNPIFQTMATLDSAYTPAAGRLRKGDGVVVQCIGAGQAMRMPQLEKCSLV